MPSIDSQGVALGYHVRRLWRRRHRKDVDPILEFDILPPAQSKCPRWMPPRKPETIKTPKASNMSAQGNALWPARTLASAALSGRHKFPFL